MCAGARWLILCGLSLILGCVWPAWAEEQAPTQAADEAPVVLSETAARMLAMGKLLMGQNNPTYALRRERLNIDVRNAAGEQANRMFSAAVTDSPKSPECWMWLGIGLTETLKYSKEHPEGGPAADATKLTEGIDAFRKAHELDPRNLIYVSYYGEALMTHAKDFAGARLVWENFLPHARTDMQRTTVDVQIARSYLNMAYFAYQQQKKLTPDIKEHFRQAEIYLQKAASRCPNATDVIEMRALLTKYRKQLSGQ